MPELAAGSPAASYNSPRFDNNREGARLTATRDLAASTSEPSLSASFDRGKFS